MFFTAEDHRIASEAAARHEERAARMDAERRTRHAAHVAEFNEQQRLLRGAQFVVIETATGRAVGDGKPMPHGFAKHVRDMRDTFGEGAFLVKRCT